MLMKGCPQSSNLKKVFLKTGEHLETNDEQWSMNNEQLRN